MEEHVRTITPTVARIQRCTDQAKETMFFSHCVREMSKHSLPRGASRARRAGR